MDLTKGDIISVLRRGRPIRLMVVDDCEEGSSVRCVDISGNFEIVRESENMSLVGNIYDKEICDTLERGSVLDLHNWDLHELGKEIRGASILKLVSIYEREEQGYRDKCVEYVNTPSNLNEEKEKVRQECEYQNRRVMKVAKRLADALIENKNH